MLVCLLACGGCLGKDGAVSVRWRIAERETGNLDDPRDVADDTGVCCQAHDAGRCAGQPGWRITRVKVIISDPDTLVPEPDAPTSGLDAPCGARELTTPFDIKEGLFAITLRAFDPAIDPSASGYIEAESPSPEIRTVRKAEIVNLDIVELSVSTQ